MVWHSIHCEEQSMQSKILTYRPEYFRNNGYNVPELEQSILDISSSSEEDEKMDRKQMYYIDASNKDNEDASNEANEDYCEYSGSNEVIRCLEEAMQIQEARLGKHHAVVSRMLHALALEHRTRGNLSVASSCLQKAIKLVDERIDLLTMEEDGLHKNHMLFRLLEEKSALFACEASVHRMRKMFTESMDSYVSSVDTLVEAGYDGSSPRIAMLMRIMKRTADSQRTDHSH